MKHFLSETAVWESISEFVSPNGKISYAEGESVITISEKEITNNSWAQIGDMKRTNHYKITPLPPTELTYESVNPELGKQTGAFHLDRNTLFSKFKIAETSLSGYEIIRREMDVCYAQGALYDNDKLINTWNAKLTLRQ